MSFKVWNRAPFLRDMVPLSISMEVELTQGWFLGQCQWAWHDTAGQSRGSGLRCAYFIHTQAHLDIVARWHHDLWSHHAIFAQAGVHGIGRINQSVCLGEDVYTALRTHTAISRVSDCMHWDDSGVWKGTINEMFFSPFFLPSLPLIQWAGDG